MPICIAHMQRLGSCIAQQKCKWWLKAIEMQSVVSCPWYDFSAFTAWPQMLVKDMWTIHPLQLLEMTIICLAKSDVHQMVQNDYAWQRMEIYSVLNLILPPPNQKKKTDSPRCYQYFSLFFHFFGHDLQVLVRKYFTYLLISSRWSSKSTIFSHFFVVTWSARTTLVEGSFRTSWLLPSDPAWRQLFDESLVYNCICH